MLNFSLQMGSEWSDEVQEKHTGAAETLSRISSIENVGDLDYDSAPLGRTTGWFPYKAGINGFYVIIPKDSKLI